MKYFNQGLLIGALLGLTAPALHAQTSTVLEGFETFTNFDNTGALTQSTNGASVGQWTYYGPRGGSDQVLVSVYTATNANDPRVTEGSNSIAVQFLIDGFGNDLEVTLSDIATAAIENAALSNQPARYILRYDVIFPNAPQYIYFNQHSFIGSDWNYVNLGGAVMKTNNGVVYGIVSFSEPLDQGTLFLPASGPFGAPSSVNGTLGASWVVADQFGTTQSPFTNCTIYIDNIRLVDTYATPTTTAIVYPLQSFETSTGGATNMYPATTFFGGNPVSDRTTLTQFATNGLYNPAVDGVPGVYTTNSGPADGDFGVTDGTHALQISEVDPGYQFQFDFAVPFAGTALAQLLAQHPSQSRLAQYTLRWDATLPAVSSDGDYVNVVLDTGSAYLPMAMGRRQYAGQTGLQRITYSVTLDQISSWGGSPTGGDPALLFSFDVPPETPDTFVYYMDNFRLIDTAPQAPSIVSTKFNPTTRQFTLTWDSHPSTTYAVQYSAGINPSSFSNLATGIASGGFETSATVTVPVGNIGYLRVVASQ